MLLRSDSPCMCVERSVSAEKEKINFLRGYEEIMNSPFPRLF